ncbi:MAG: helix-turn-helix transcriptional regulator [Alphaproteobacteria bacterium]|nr:helix-turn-helix transcriptional regulator [Alphaproteobacteria bacterium]
MLVQKLRPRRGWSQEQLAALCMLSPRPIQRIEHGQNASLETLKSLASVQEIDLTTLQEPDMPTSNASAVSRQPSAVSTEEALVLAQVRRIVGEAAGGKTTGTPALVSFLSGAERTRKVATPAPDRGSADAEHF